MPNMIYKWMRKGGGRRRKGSGKRDHKSWALTDAGVRLLALKDYDALPMAKIAKEAGVSVGALYARFPEKHAYLYHVIAAALHNLEEDAKSALDANVRSLESATASVRRIVRHVVGAMTARKAAGVIRATVKLATIKPLTIELFEDYRKAVADQAVALLFPKLHRTTPHTIRIAMQIVLGTITDSVLQKKAGPMNTGSARMVDALTNVMLGYLGLSEGSWAGEEAEDEDEAPDDDELTEEPPTDGSVPVFEPEFRRYVRKRSTSPAQTPAKPVTRKRAPPALSNPIKTQASPSEPKAADTVKVVKPPRALTPPLEAPPPKRKRRVI